MARIVETLFDKPGTAEFGKFAGYPWEEWTDGQIRELHHGEDFSVAVKTFRVYLYNYKEAMNRGEVPTPDSSVETWEVRTKLVGPEVIRFYFCPADAPPD